MILFMVGAVIGGTIVAGIGLYSVAQAFGEWFGY